MCILHRYNIYLKCLIASKCINNINKILFSNNNIQILSISFSLYEYIILNKIQYLFVFQTRRAIHAT